MEVEVKITRKSTISLILAFICIPLFAYLFSFTTINDYVSRSYQNPSINFVTRLSMPATLQVFYTPSNYIDLSFSEEYSVKYQIPKTQDLQKVSIELPYSTKFDKFRLDFGNQPGLVFVISGVILKEKNNIKLFIIDQTTKLRQIKSVNSKHSLNIYKTTGRDPQITFTQTEKLKNNSLFTSIGLFSWLSSIALFLILQFLFPFFSVRKGNSTDSMLYKKLLPVLFIIMMILPLWGLKYRIDKPWTSEKRTLKVKPIFNKEKIFSYSHDYEMYFNDKYGYRNHLIYCYNYLTYRIFNQSPLPDKLFLGPDNWMFYFKYPEQIFDTRYTNEQLFTIKENIERRSLWCKEQGIRFYLMISPEKLEIYPEFFPDYDSTKNKIIKVAQLESYLKDNSFFKIVNCRPSLIREKKIHRLYYKTDTHWNDLGAFCGYKELIEQIKTDFPQIPTYEFDDFTIKESALKTPNIAMIIGVDTAYGTENFLVPKIDVTAKQKFKQKFSQDDFSEILVYETPNKYLPKMMMFRDSYGEYLIKYLNESFQRSTYVFTNYIDESIVMKDKPDILIYQLSLGRMNLLLKY